MATTMRLKSIRVASCLLAGAALTAGGVALGVDNWDYLRPRLSHYKELATRAVSPGYLRSKEAIAAHVREQGLTGSDRFDYVREFVNDNSIHSIDDEFDQYAFSEEKVMPLLWGNYQGENRKPHLSCGPRTYAMKQILEALGHEARVVDIFSGPAQSHTFLEVYDEVAGAWQIQDPDFNVTYRASDGQRLSAVELVTRPGNDVHMVGDVDERLRENVVGLPNYYRAALIRDTYDGRRATFIYNPDRFDATEDGPSGAEMLRVARARFHEPAIIHVSGGARSEQGRGRSEVASLKR